MTTNYDEIADDYIRIKDHPIKTHYESFTFLHILGDIRAKSVLDLACGNGYYTRLLKNQGAARVVGVDVSKNMINSARAIEKAAPLGLEYHVKDVTNLKQIGQFDIVTSVYLLPYAATKQSLMAMCQTMYTNLKPGGKLVSITLNPNLSAKDLTIYHKYGIRMVAQAGLQDGAKITFIIDTPDGAVELLPYHWQQTTYEDVLHQVGFRNVIWPSYQVSPEGIRVYGQEYWQPLLTKPYAAMIEGTS